MANRDKNGKSLGQDPFADLDDFDFETIDAAVSAPAPDLLKATQGEDEKPAPPPKAKKKPPADPEPDDPTSNFEVGGEAEASPPNPPEVGEETKVFPTEEITERQIGDGLNDDSTPSQPPPARERSENFSPGEGLTQAQTGDQVNDDTTLLQSEAKREEDENLPPSEELSEPGPTDDDVPTVSIEPPTAVEPTTVPEMAAEPNEETAYILDDLIATIDDEIERTFTGGTTTTIASQRQSQQQAANQAQYVIFRLAGTQYAAPALTIKEVGEMTNLTPVPNVPAWLMGVTNLRGDILSVVDLRLFLGLEQTDYDETAWQGDVLMGAEQEMLIAQANDPTGLMVALLVDVVSDIRYLNVDNIERPKAPIEDKITPYLQGIYEDEDENEFLVVLDFEKLLLSSEMRQFELTKQF